MRGQTISKLIGLVLAIGVASLAVSCGTANLGADAPLRGVSENYTFTFVSVPGVELPLATYYVIDQGESGEYQVFEAVNPRETIENYTEYAVNGDGPLGAGDYLIRVFNPLEYVWDTREDFYLVSGL